MKNIFLLVIASFVLLSGCTQINFSENEQTNATVPSLEEPPLEQSPPEELPPVEDDPPPEEDSQTGTFICSPLWDVERVVEGFGISKYQENAHLCTGKTTMESCELVDIYEIATDSFNVEDGIPDCEWLEVVS